ncbi:MAG: 23S rRNA (pseudouridine(1915)-N(3))-methyltransferase RlmH [Clostridia bacterium]
MNITIYTPTKKMLTYFNQAIKEYQKRLSKFAKINAKTYKDKNIEKVIKTNTHLIKVSPKGKLISSEKLAQELSTLAINGISDISFILTDKQITHFKHIALSKMTISDQLSLVVLFEQIYRSFSINNNMPYHK